MATPKWNRVNYQAVGIPQGGGRQQTYDSPVNNIDLALGRFRDVLKDYGAIQDRDTNAELARRTMGMSDPDAIRQAIADGSLVVGLDPRSVTSQAYTNANDQISNILSQRAQDLGNRTGEFALNREQHNFGRQTATERARDALIGQQQRLAQLGTQGDVRGQGDLIASIDQSLLTPEALDILTKGNVTNIGVPVRGQNITIRGQDIADRNSQRSYAARMAQVNQARQALQVSEQNRIKDEQAQRIAYDISRLPESMQEIALNSAQGNRDMFWRIGGNLDRIKQGKNVPLDGSGSSTNGSGRGRSSGNSIDSPTAAEALRDDIVRANRAPVTESEMRAESLMRQAAGFDSTFPVAEPFQKAPANATEDQAISFYLKNAGNSQHSESSLRQGYKQLEAELKERGLDKRFSTAEKLQLLDQGMERNPDWANPVNLLLGRGNETTFNIDRVSGVINDVGSGANAANSKQRSNVTNQVAEVRKLASEFDSENRKFSQLSNDIARADIPEEERAYYNNALLAQAEKLGLLKNRLDSSVTNAQRLMEGAGLIKPPKGKRYVPPSRKQILDQFRRERAETERLRTTPTNIR